jgi:hypothetical protein
MIKLSTEDLQLEIVADGELGLYQKQSAMTGINMMPDIYAFCLPGLVEELTHSTSFLAHVSIIACSGIQSLTGMLIHNHII